MVDSNLVDRLAALPTFAGFPRNELEWLVEHAESVAFAAAGVLSRKGDPVEYLYILLEGRIAIRVDRGAGPKLVMKWGKGEVTGLLPYSRMTSPPGDTYAEVPSEALAIHKSCLQEMVKMCPAFTASTVHEMVDRARSFNTSDLQDEKMMSLGKLAAGLAHELNNPASAIVRSAKLLRESMAEADMASRALGSAGLSPQALSAIADFRSACIARSSKEKLTPLQHADREDELSGWLESKKLDETYAATLVDTSATPDMLETLSKAIPGEQFDIVLRWISAGCVTQSLSFDIEEASSRVYELVAAVKKFTYMDQLANAESVSVSEGLQDTVRVLASKANQKEVEITLDIEPGLPTVFAGGGHLNQVWMSLIENALDAVPYAGHVAISAAKELDRVVVRVADDGSGIPAEIAGRIFDPFFTTKPPGHGTGLGLDIARKLVRRYQGDIALQSVPGRTEFAVSIPAEEAAQVFAAVEEASGQE